MKKIVSAIALAGCLGTGVNAANFDIGISGSERGISGFALSIGDYYHVPVRDVVVLERHIPRDELSVVYFLADHSHRHAGYIADLRMRGLSWWDISIRLGLDPHTLYVVDSRRHSGPPYGKAYGYYKEGKKYRLRDHEIVELVNVRFLSNYHHVHVDDVIDRRRRGERYFFIDEHYRGSKVYPKQREGYIERREYRDEHREYRDERREHRNERREYREERKDRGDRGDGPGRATLRVNER